MSLVNAVQLTRVPQVALILGLVDVDEQDTERPPSTGGSTFHGVVQCTEVQYPGVHLPLLPHVM